MQQNDTVSKSLTRTIDFEIRRANASNIGELCRLTDECLTIAKSLNFPANFTEIQRYLLTAEYKVLILQENKLQGFACFSACEVNKKNALYMHIILLKKDIQKKGLFIKVLNRMMHLLDTDYLVIPETSLADDLDTKLSKMHQFEKVCEDCTLPYSNYSFGDDDNTVVIFKRK